MGAYLEKTMSAFVEIQNTMQDQSNGMYIDKNGQNPEMWTQFMSMQTPMIQSMMSNYIEQSKNLFVQMQDQVEENTRSMFDNFNLNKPPADKE